MSSTLIYLPYADERATGMQRFGSQMIMALLRHGLDATLLIGEQHGHPAWLDGLAARVMLRDGFLPRFARPAVRMAWLQVMLGRLSRGAVVLALAHELAPFTRVRQIAVVHDLTHLKGFTAQSPADRFRHKLWISGLRRAEAIIAISQTTRRELIETLGLEHSKIRVIHEGYDPAIFKPGPRGLMPSRPYLLYAGTLADNKNIPFLLRVFVRVRQRFDVSIKLAGRQDAETVAALLEEVPESIRGDVEFCGFVSDPQLAALMQGCRAFVFPSLNEGFGLAPVEAMACGAPVVASNAGSLPEIIGDGGSLHDPADETAWTDELGRVLADDAYCADLSQRSLTRAGAYSWDRAALEYLDVLSAV